MNQKGLNLEYKRDYVEGVYIRQGTSSVPATESAILKMIKKLREIIMKRFVL